MDFGFCCCHHRHSVRASREEGNWRGGFGDAESQEEFSLFSLHEMEPGADSV